MKRLIPALAAIALTIGGCSATDGEAPSTGESSTTSQAQPSTAQSSETTTAQEPETVEPPALQASEAPAQFAPGDPGLLPYDAVGNIGIFLDEAHAMDMDGHYWLCNGGDLTLADGAPVESGTCEGPLTLQEATFRNDWSGAIPEIDRRIEEEVGEPAQSSGESQTQYGCEQGYITDPELCAAVGVDI